MFLLDDQNTIINAEWSLDLLKGSPCVVVESSGGANPALGTKRRNPDYNELLSLIFRRLAHSGIKITRIVLDSSKVSSVSVDERAAKLDRPYPVDLSATDIDEFRKMLQREISCMHQGNRGQRDLFSEKIALALFFQHCTARCVSDVQ